MTKPLLMPLGSADSWATVPEPGICGFKIGQGAHDRAMNGVGIWFWSIATNPLTRFAAFLNHRFTWSDQSSIPAYNQASVNLWVWGRSGKRLVSPTRRLISKLERRNQRIRYA